MNKWIKIFVIFSKVYVEVLHTLETAWMKGILARRRWHRWYHAIVAMNRYICHTFRYITLHKNYKIISRMRKMSADNRWRNSPRHKPDADQSQANGHSGLYTSSRHFTSAITRQLTLLRESWSRHFETLSERYHSKDNSEEIEGIQHWLELNIFQQTMFFKCLKQQILDMVSSRRFWEFWT